MPSTGWVIAGAAASVATSPTGHPWVDPGNVTLDDGSSAEGGGSAKISVYTEYLQATSFGVSLPGGALPVGVEVRIKRRQSAGSSTRIDRFVQLVVGGVVVGDNNADLLTNWPASLTDADYGGAADLWGLASLSKAQVEASDFGVVVAGESVTGSPSFYVDAMWVNIHYVYTGGNRGYIIG